MQSIVNRSRALSTALVLLSCTMSRGEEQPVFGPPAHGFRASILSTKAHGPKQIIVHIMVQRLPGSEATVIKRLETATVKYLSANQRVIYQRRVDILFPSLKFICFETNEDKVGFFVELPGSRKLLNQTKEIVVELSQLGVQTNRFRFQRDETKRR